MKKQKITLFCLGYGYTAQALVSLLGDRCERVIATTRSEQTARNLDKAGISAVFLGDDGGLLPSLPEGAHWLVSAPPDDDGCPAFERFADQARHAAWIGYLSTTGVYGDLGGRWAFEWSDLKPQSQQGTRRVLAEAQWLSSGYPTQVFRLPGIYGPGRSVFDRLADGTARRIIKPDQVFSRVHVEDIASCLVASMDRPNTGRIYHPCDDEPAPPQDVIAYAAGVMGVPCPPDIPFESADLSPMARRFYDECKRVSNARTKSELGWLPRYKSYRDGLDAIWRQSQANSRSRV